MKQIGLSLYPLKCSLDEQSAYLKRGAENGFSRLFIAFLGVEPNPPRLREVFGPILKLAKALNYEISCDVNQEVLKGVSGEARFGQYDLSLFKELGIDILRLDLGMSEFEETFFIKNPYGIKVELNMSMDIDHVSNLLALGAPKERILGCHNYYPHAYTGLSLEHFKKCTAIWTPHHLRTAAFISTQSPLKYGPWPVCDGLPTLEMHRHLPMTTQLKHYLAMDVIDDVLIGDAFAIDEELVALGKVNRERLDFKVAWHPDLSPDFRKLFNNPLSRRPDINDYLVRSVEGRLFFCNTDIQPFNTVDIKRGDVLIDNNLYGQYRGEIQIALKDMKNSGRTNVVGHIVDHEIFLIDLLKPGQSFGFEEN